MKRFAADLHIHTALSPCADDTMTPPAIVQAALHEGLDMIAICDHNSAGNVAAVQEAAAAVQGTAGADLAVLAGMEITTAEEAHVLGLFPDADAATAAAETVRDTLLPMTERDARFGDALLMNARGETLGREAKLLSMASGLDLADTVGLIRRHGGLAIASHVDRPSHSVMSQLGLFPTDVTFDAIEVSGIGVAESREAAFADLGLPMVTSSDGHFVTDIGTARTTIEMGAATFDELKMALKGQDGRGLCALEGTSIA